MKEGSKVLLKPTNMASDELKDKLGALGEVVGVVVDITGIGVCTVILPVGIEIEGHSHPLENGQHYIDLHSFHLEVVI